MLPFNWLSLDRGAYRNRPVGHTVFAGRRLVGLFSLSSAALTVLLALEPVQAQTLPEALTPTNTGTLPSSATTPATSEAASSPATQPRTGTAATRNQGPPQPEFQAGAAISFSESYVTNPSGLPGSTQADEISSPRLSADLHEHSRSLTVDANYSGTADFYAHGTLPTQYDNNMQAVGSLDVIPNELTLGAKAFAQPVEVSSLGAVTTYNQSVPNGYSNSYGYIVTPDLKFNLGNFATSETVPNFGQDFFIAPPGSTVNVLSSLGLGGPDNTTSRGLTQSFKSGSDFERLSWTVVGSVNETESAQQLLSEKTGVANIRYAISYEFSLLGTGGYDGITNSTPLGQNVSGPIAMGGFGLTFAKEFSLQLEAGEKYNSPSYTGSLRWNITPRTLLSASLDDEIETPEGQLLNNLTGLTALSNGSLGPASSILGNGSLASLSSFNIQSQGNLALDQTISRYQTGQVSLSEDVERNHASIFVNGTRGTILGGVFVGSPKTFTWSAGAQFSRDLTRLMRAGFGASYGEDNQFGGNSQTLQVQGQWSYQLSRLTSIYVSADYVTRWSASSLQALSPFAGDTKDARITIGISHAL